MNPYDAYWNAAHPDDETMSIPIVQGEPPVSVPPIMTTFEPQPPKARVHPVTWVALAVAVFAMIEALVGDNSPIITASGPLTTAAFLAVAGLVLSVIGMVKGAATWAWISLVIAGLALALASHDLVTVHQQMDKLHQCLSDLIACGEQNQ